jgi:hypothetical protein
MRGLMKHRDAEITEKGTPASLGVLRVSVVILV